MFKDASSLATSEVMSHSNLRPLAPSRVGSCASLSDNPSACSSKQVWKIICAPSVCRMLLPILCWLCCDVLTSRQHEHTSSAAGPATTKVPSTRQLCCHPNAIPTMAKPLITHATVRCVVRWLQQDIIRVSCPGLLLQSRERRAGGCQVCRQRFAQVRPHGREETPPEGGLVPHVSQFNGCSAMQLHGWVPTLNCHWICPFKACQSPLTNTQHKLRRYLMDKSRFCASIWHNIRCAGSLSEAWLRDFTQSLSSMQSSGEGASPSHHVMHCRHSYALSASISCRSSHDCM